MSGFNLMNGLMAGSSFGNGFMNGQDQERQMAARNQQQQMALMMGNMQLQNEQTNMGYAQEESEYARKVATDPNTANLPIDQKMDLLTKNAMSNGDLVRANELAVNATNFRQAQVVQDQKKVAIETGQINNQQKLHQYMGSELAAAADQGPEAFNAARLQALSSGYGTPMDRQNLTSLKWDSKLGDRLRMGAMTSRQQAQTQLEQAKLQQTAKNQALMERSREISQSLLRQRITDRENQESVKAKAGAGVKSPTPNELDDSAPYLADSGLDPKSADFAQAQQSLVAVKKSLQKVNPNLPDAQAFQQAARLVEKQDLNSVTIPGGLLSSDTKKVSYKMAGANPKNPIPYNGDPSTLIPGRYYTTGSHGVLQFTGTGWLRVQ